jgi:hypothetical protein
VHYLTYQVIVRPLRQLVPPYLLAGRWIVVLVCYLDDSGKDPQNPITTLAGYIARDTAWEAFESDVEPWFSEFNVGILHAKQLHDTDADFKGWPVLKKQTFVSRICQARNPHIMMGLSMSAEKGTYKLQTAQSNRKRTATPYSFCFNVINDWVFRDIRIGRAANTEGVAYVLECGHENNAEVQKEFYAIKQQHPDIADLMHLISFVGKASCRAIQLADLLAFYSRRDDAAALKAKKEGRDSYQIETMIRIITENLPHRGFVATAFDQFAEGSRFWAGDP